MVAVAHRNAGNAVLLRLAAADIHRAGGYDRAETVAAVNRGGKRRFMHDADVGVGIGAALLDALDVILHTENAVGVHTADVGVQQTAGQRRRILIGKTIFFKNRGDEPLKLVYRYIQFFGHFTTSHVFQVRFRRELPGKCRAARHAGRRLRLAEIGTQNTKLVQPVLTI